MSFVGGATVGQLAVGTVDVSGNNFILSVSTGTFTLTGQAVTFAIVCPISQGSYSLSGQAVTLGAAIVPVQGSYSLTGQSTTFAILLPVSQGSYSQTGQASTLGATILPVRGSYSLSGFPTTVSRAISLLVSTGSFFTTIFFERFNLKKAIDWNTWSLWSPPGIGNRRHRIKSWVSKI